MERRRRVKGEKVEPFFPEFLVRRATYRKPCSDAETKKMSKGSQPGSSAVKNAVDVVPKFAPSIRAAAARKPRRRLCNRPRRRMQKRLDDCKNAAKNTPAAYACSGRRPSS